jgi:hypothetical protein
MELNSWHVAEVLSNETSGLDERNLPTVFQRRRIHRVRSRFDQAQAELKGTMESFPRDRLTLRQRWLTR